MGLWKYLHMNEIILVVMGTAIIGGTIFLLAIFVPLPLSSKQKCGDQFPNALRIKVAESGSDGAYKCYVAQADASHFEAWFDKDGLQIGEGLGTRLDGVVLK